MKIPNEINLNEAPETAKYLEEYCIFKHFDVVSFFNQMAYLERRMNMAIQIMKFADHKRMNAEEDLERERDEMADQLKETQKHLKDANRGAEINAHALRINADKLIAVTEQRDKLAEALNRISEYQGVDDEDPKTMAIEALQSLNQTTQ